MPDFINNISFCLNNLDRDGLMRADGAALNKISHSNNAVIYPFYGNNAFLSLGDEATKEREIITFSGDNLSLFGDNIGKSIYLGTFENKYYFGVQISGDENQITDEIIKITGINGEFGDLRANMGRLDPVEISIAGTARSLIAWHSTHSFCPTCGHQSNIAEGGWKRVCNANSQSCGTEHFPRVDPVAIMLVLYGDKCLLGRSVNFPEGLYSTLAGFIEPGETFEQGCKREVLEEVGIEVENIEIIGNQPWPFPSQLMIGMVAYAKNDKITLNIDEVLDAKWFSRQEVKQLIAGESMLHNDAPIYGPRAAAIAHHLLRYWLEI